METQNNEIPIIIDGVEFYKKDIVEISDYLNRLQNAYAQSELECSLFKKRYLEKLEENERLKMQIKDMELKNN